LSVVFAIALSNIDNLVLEVWGKWSIIYYLLIIDSHRFEIQYVFIIVLHMSVILSDSQSWLLMTCSFKRKNQTQLASDFPEKINFVEI